MNARTHLVSYLAVASIAALTSASIGCSHAHADEAPEHGEAAHGEAAHGEAAHGEAASAHAETAGHGESSATAAKTDSHAASGHGASGHDPANDLEPRRARYTVPFTWDASEEEPLARMRGFMRNMLTDNQHYAAEKKPEFFKAFASGQKPRATIVTCSDSRVQSTAYDASPENDVFTIRDIGNQVLTAEGSVEYGIHHLHTPLLLVLGHSGCGAVKAAMGDYSKEPSPIQRELSSLQIPKAAANATPEEALTAGVIANVHSQVSLAVLKYGEEVESGNLTVVGAVYDFRNDLGQGVGKVTVVDVNGNSDHDKVDAFARAMQLPALASGHLDKVAEHSEHGDKTSLAKIVASAESKK